MASSMHSATNVGTPTYTRRKSQRARAGIRASLPDLNTDVFAKIVIWDKQSDGTVGQKGAFRIPLGLRRMHSQYLTTVFTSSVLESSACVFELSAVQPCVFRMLVRCLYSQSIYQEASSIGVG